MEFLDPVLTIIMLLLVLLLLLLLHCSCCFKIVGAVFVIILHRYRRAERGDLAPTPHPRERSDRPGTADWRGIESSRHRRAERDGIAPAPHPRERSDRPGTAD